MDKLVDRDSAVEVGKGWEGFQDGVGELVDG